MGRITLDKSVIDTNSVKISGWFLETDDRLIQLCDKDFELKIKAEDCTIDYMKSSDPVVLYGKADSVLSDGNICITGRVTRSSVGRDRFYCETGKKEYTKAKSFCRKASDRNVEFVKIGMQGDFEYVRVDLESEYTAKIYVKGRVRKLVSARDVYCKGDIFKSRSELSTYISK